MKYTTISQDIPADGLIVKTEGLVTRLSFDFEEVEETEESKEERENGDCPTRYDFWGVDIKGARDYSTFVAGIIKSKYSDDDAQAIIINKMLADMADSDITSEKREQYNQRYIAFQSWRAHAKEVARAALNKLGLSVNE